MAENSFNAGTHIHHIDEAINELGNFHDRTVSPNPIPNQLIGTVVDSTISLLCIAANSLDGGARNIQFDEPANNWVSLMLIIHRSFFSMIHAYFEYGITKICEKLKIEVKASVPEQYLKILEEIKKESTNEIRLKELINYFERERKRPSFTDYLNAVLKKSGLDKDRQEVWRNFFNGLRILRNKSSHSNTTLLQNEIEILRKGGMAVVVSSSETLQFNTRMYAQITNLTLDFWNELIDSFDPEISNELKNWTN